MPLAEDAAHFIHADGSVADNIRALDAAGYSRADIARLLNKRYQHVRNVLEGDKLKAAPSRPAAKPWEEPRTVPLGDSFRMTVGQGGVVILPPELMEAFDLHPGTTVIARLEGASFAIISPRESWRRATAAIPPWRPGEPLWSEELIAERRREAQKEEEENG